MNDIGVVLDRARRGDSEHSAAIERYLKNFRHIILRGAGKFGTAFGTFLIAVGIPPEHLCYWDNRASELGKVNGVQVLMPFSSEFNRESTLIINCIPNGSLSGSVGEQEFLERGYHRYLSGMALFEALMCALKPGTEFDASVCLNTTFCNWCACQRLPSLLKQHCMEEHSIQEGELIWPVATFVLNQKCTLECRHCGQYINHYRPEDRVNFPLERIKADIDRIFAAVDAIGYVSLIGGEPFLHPDLIEIVEHVLTKPNFGVIGITTNGICSIDLRQLEKLNNGRTRLIFSDYTRALSDKQRELFAKNVKLAEESGISYTVGEPLWSTPASLRKLELPQTSKDAMKKGCNSLISCKTIQNGVYYPCSTTAGIGSHNLAEYPHDWVRLDAAGSVGELRKKILRVNGRQHYESCDHCGEGGELLPMPGEQGGCDRYWDSKEHRD